MVGDGSSVKDREGSTGSGPRLTGLPPVRPSSPDCIGESGAKVATGASAGGGNGVPGMRARISTEGTGVPGLMPAGVAGTAAAAGTGAPEEGAAGAARGR